MNDIDGMDIMDERGSRPFTDIPVVTVPPERRKNPVAFLMEAAILHGPIFRRETPRRLIPRYGPWQVYLVGPDANRFVFHTHRHLFSHEYGWRAFFGGVWNENLLYLDHETHARHRRLMQPAFSPAAIASAIPLMQEAIHAGIAEWGGQIVNVRLATRTVAFHAVAGALLHFGPVDAVARLHADRDALCRNLHPFGKEKYLEHIRTYREVFNNRLRQLLDTRLPHDEPDLIDRLRDALEGEHPVLTQDQLLGHLQILLEAGHTTTMDVATWTLGLLATHPEIQERTREEIDAVTGGADIITSEMIRQMHWLGHVIAEAGRLRTPVDTAPRVTLADVTFGGYVIPAGTFVRLSLGACHRLPSIFARPGCFDPARFLPPREEEKRTPYSLVTFGGGSRVCIGGTFALTEIKVLVAMVLQRFYLVGLPDETPANVWNPEGCDDSLPRGLPVLMRDRGQN